MPGALELKIPPPLVALLCAVGMAVGLPKRQEATGAAAPKDDLDKLMDSLDDLAL